MKKLIVANWKMNPENLAEAKGLFLRIRSKVARLRRTEVVIAPPNVYLSAVVSILKSKNIFLGVQDISAEAGGAFTGETSVAMVKSLGASLAIVGHSERRAMGETSELVNRKAIAALRGNLRTIVCVGEKIRDPEGEYLHFLKNQIRESLHRMPRKFLENLVIAYEPVWAIGRSDREAMKGRDVHEMKIFIRKILSDMYSPAEVAEVPILYGGSTSPRNTDDILKMGEADGLLVGRESLNPESFAMMLDIADGVK